MNLFGKWTQAFWTLQGTTSQVYFIITMTKVREEYFTRDMGAKFQIDINQTK